MTGLRAGQSRCEKASARCGQDHPHSGPNNLTLRAMAFPEDTLSRPRPSSVRRDLALPRRTASFASPIDWRDEVLYFLLIDRFSDERARPLLDRSAHTAARPAGWSWQDWAQSGAERFQGGTLRGVLSRLDYLSRLGVSTLWLSPLFKQRGHENTFHGYAIQDFLDVDPRFGDRSDLVDLVTAAHARGIRVILDVVFQHSGPNWLYAQGTPGGELTPVYTTGQYPFGSFRGDQGQQIAAIRGSEDGVWPRELQDGGDYTRAGSGNLGAGDIDDPNAEHKRSDFFALRDFALDAVDVLSNLARCFKYWIALADVDGFRIDTLKHVSTEQARNFCGTIKEFAANLGKQNFFLVGEIAGGDFAEDRYLDVLEANLNAALDIGEMRPTLVNVAKGLVPGDAYFAGYDVWKSVMGSHRNVGNQHVSICDDHDCVFGQKLRFASDAASEHQVIAAVALQLFTLGIPCVYYGTEQGFGGPEPSARRWLPEWGSSDRYLREAMFGPEHPRASGRAGLTGGLDLALPGFGAFGTVGRHCFDDSHPAYIRMAAMLTLRRGFPVLRHGRQYVRPLSNFGADFASPPAGELLAWSRILDDEEALCVVNAHGTELRGADVLIDAGLNADGAPLQVLLNTAQAADPAGYAGTHPVGSQIAARTRAGTRFVEIRSLSPSEVLVIGNRA
jgi:glycosidase